eukprot:SAG31_NODE_9636_length_1248_cov_1.075718_2_plen_55_part_00
MDGMKMVANFVKVAGTGGYDKIADAPEHEETKPIADDLRDEDVDGSNSHEELVE